MPMIKRLLIANRAEIACRIIKTTQRLGITSLAVYSTADKDSLHVSLADEAYWIGDKPAKDSYLNSQAIIEIARQQSADAIHPGYGFLSENPDFARACEKANILFVGPSVEAMQLMASKQLAKQHLQSTQVPLTPGYHGLIQTDSHLLNEAERIGFPLMVKAANGGGGKGMRAVYSRGEFLAAVAAARREALAYFGDETLLLEQLITTPRHIEIQIIADNFGEFVHLFERDCSIQRRHQKIIEEAPAPNLDATLRNKLAQSAIEVAKAIDYRGAGTVEFLVDKHNQYYFMEMNTRLQVEHPITEMITGIDLVEWQLRVAANQALPCPQSAINISGHAIECRIYAENPFQEFLPSSGQLDGLHEPSNEGIRIDSGICATSVINNHYDPLLAKLIAWGESREQAIARLENALKHYYIAGIHTNIEFLKLIIQQPNYLNASITTDFLTTIKLDSLPPSTDPRPTLLFACSLDYLNLIPKTPGLKQATFGFQNQTVSYWFFEYLVDEISYSIKLIPLTNDTFKLAYNNHQAELRVKLTGQYLHVDDGRQTWHAWISQTLASTPATQNHLTFYTPNGPLHAQRPCITHQPTTHQANTLNAPISSTVVRLLKQPGDTVSAKEDLIILEAMKMEYIIQAPCNGVIDALFYEVGAQVNQGAELGRLRDPEGRFN